jgi:hypothetical protein
MRPLRLLALAAVSLLPMLSALGAEPRLFYTPAERARVTAERADMLAREARAGAPLDTTVVPADSEVPGTQAATEAAPDTIAGPLRLQGVSLKDTGRAYAWIGGRRYQDGELIDGQRLRVQRNGVQLLGATGSGRSYRIGEVIPGSARK